MSQNWVQDIEDMHDKYGVPEWIAEVVRNEEYDKLKEYLAFRIRFLEEELNETKIAAENCDAEEIVDGLIDLCVVAIGTLDAFCVNSERAWDRVLKANMAKEVGVKESRPNPLGLPDLVKPEGWTAPSHEHNHGLLSLISK